MENTNIIGEIRFFTLVEVAHRLGMSRSSIYVHIASGDLTITKFGRLSRIASSDLETFIASRPRSRAVA